MTYGPHTLVYRCIGCGEWRPWCDGSTDSEECDACWAGSGHHACSECCPENERDENGRPKSNWKPYVALRNARAHELPVVIEYAHPQ